MFVMEYLRCSACGSVNKEWTATPAEVAAQRHLCKLLAERYAQAAIRPGGDPGGALSQVARDLHALATSIGTEFMPFPLPELNLRPWGTRVGEEPGSPT